MKVRKGTVVNITNADGTTKKVPFVTYSVVDERGVPVVSPTTGQPMRWFPSVTKVGTDRVAEARTKQSNQKSILDAQIQKGTSEIASSQILIKVKKKADDEGFKQDFLTSWERIQGNKTLSIKERKLVDALTHSNTPLSSTDEKVMRDIILSNPDNFKDLL